MINPAKAFVHSSQIVCLVTAMYAFKGTETHWPSFFFIYFACFFTYNAERLFTPSNEDAINHPLRQKWIKKNESLMKKLCVSSLLSCLMLYAQLNHFQSIILFVCVIPTALYLIPKVNPSNKRLKELFMAKEISIAICWALTTAYLSRQNQGFIFFLMLLFLALINVISCDYADSFGDLKCKIKTLANINIHRTPGMIYLLCLTISILALLLKLPGFALAAIHIVIYLDKKDSFQFDIALIWPALFCLI